MTREIKRNSSSPTMSLNSNPVEGYIINLFLKILNFVQAIAHT